MDKISLSTLEDPAGSCVYELFSHTVRHEETQGTSYGVRIAAEAEEAVQFDLCPNQAAAEQFLSRLARNQALPIELPALAEDFLAQ